MAAPAGLVDHALRVLDAHTNGKRLGLHGHATAVQHDKGVARTVAQRHDGVARVQGVALARAQVFYLQPGELLATGDGRKQHIAHALLKADLAAQRDDLLADVFHHLDQLEGADVRVCGVQDVGGCACMDEFINDLAAQVARVLDLAVELAVREGARTAFAKLHIALRVEDLFAPQAPGVLGAFTHGLAAFEHDGLETHLRQRQGSEHAARPKAHHHRALAGRCTKIGGGLAGRVPGHVGGGLDVGMLVKLLQQRCLGLCIVQ